MFAMQDHGSVDSVFTLTVYASCLDAEDVQEERRDLGQHVRTKC